MAVVPATKAVYLCEEVDVEGGLINLYGLFRTLHSADFPYTRDSFVAFAQLGNGLGDIPCYFDIRRASDGLLIHTSTIRTLRFTHRYQLVRLAIEFRGIRFPSAGVYLIEMFCDNTWVADVTLELREGYR